MSWVDRVSHTQTPPLKQVCDAAENLAGQAGISPGKMRVAFQTVTDMAIIASALTATTLAAMHLYKTLFPPHNEDQRSPETAGSGCSPPRRRDPRVTAPGEDHGRHEKHGTRSR